MIFRISWRELRLHFNCIYVTILLNRDKISGEKYYHEYVSCQKNVIKNIYKSEMQKRNSDITLFILFIFYFFTFYKKICYIYYHR